jgi:VWFA-related protein
MKLGAGLVGAWVALLSFVLALNDASSAQTSITRQVHVLATRDGKFVADLSPADLEIEEGGKKAVIQSVTRSTMPLRLVLIVADAGAGEFQPAAARLIQPLAGKGEISIIAVPNRPDRLVEFTSDPAALDKAIAELGATTALRQDEPHLMSALLEAFRGIRKEGTRPVVVMFSIGGDQGDERQEEMTRALESSGALLYALTNNAMAVRTGSVPGGRRGGSAAGGPGSSTRATAIILGDGTRHSGGIHVRANPPAFAGVAHQIADELQRYHLVTYTLPPGAKTSENLAVTTKTEGLKLRAPSRIPK